VKITIAADFRRPWRGPCPSGHGPHWGPCPSSCSPGWSSPASPSPLQVCTVVHQYTLIKKKIKFFLIYNEIQSGAVAKSYMRRGFLIYEERRKYLTIYEEAVSHIHGRMNYKDTKPYMSAFLQN
jgi:hypothetical protein